jgi:hypothetical protein
MAGGWLTGLGQGLQGATKGVEVYHTLRQQALENALRERQMQQQEESQRTQIAHQDRTYGLQKSQEERGLAKDLYEQQLGAISDAPDNSHISGAERDKLNPLLRGLFTQQSTNLGSKPITAAGIGQLEPGTPHQDEFDIIQPQTVAQRIAATKSADAAAKLQQQMLYQGGMYDLRKAGQAADERNQRDVHDARMGQLDVMIRGLEERQQSGDAARSLQADLDNARREMQARQAANVALVDEMKNNIKAFMWTPEERQVWLDARTKQELGYARQVQPPVMGPVVPATSHVQPNQPVEPKWTKTADGRWIKQ